MQAEIIAIGTELLLGNTLDTNTQYLAVLLRGLGIDLYRTTIIGDNADRIASTIQESLDRADVVITSGGLGPTIDDATREGIAQALGLALEFRPELWDQIEARFARFGRRPTDNNRRQAHIPRGAIGIENPVGTAPAFYIERNDKIIVALPGVPAELKYLAESTLVPLLASKAKQHYVILTRHILTAGIGESWLDQQIQDLERGANPTVGLSAGPGRVDIRITAKAAQEDQARLMLDQVEDQLRARIAPHIYGVDDETLEGSVAQLLRGQGLMLVIGLHGAEIQALATVIEQSGLSGSLSQIVSVNESGELMSAIERLIAADLTLVGLTLDLQMNDEEVEFNIGIFLQNKWKKRHRTYGGAPTYAPAYALSYALDTLRRRLLDNRAGPAL